MFLEKTMEKNPKLVKTVFELCRNSKIQPDSYVVDLDILLQNAREMLEKSKGLHIDLFFMLKQLGRNPLIAEELIKLGYSGAVVVDFKEAQVMMKANIPIMNVGNLVQIPESQIEAVVAYNPKFITAFSMDMIKSIQRAAKKANCVQNILLRVYEEGDMMYSGQEAGISVKDLPNLVKAVKSLENVAIRGVTSFPCFLYKEATEKMEPTHNINTLKKAKEILEGLGIEQVYVNMPSGTCDLVLEQIRELGGNCGEPGHGLTGTTPMHAVSDLKEQPCVVYVSEISHNFEGKSYCYGGGYYRRSCVKNALVGDTFENAEKDLVSPPSDESIDYYFGLFREHKKGETVVMAFRYQIFVTRSDVVLVKGIQSGEPQIVGIYDSMGKKADSE